MISKDVGRGHECQEVAEFPVSKGLGGGLAILSLAGVLQSCCLGGFEKQECLPVRIPRPTLKILG